jgi:hypothetical protein
MRCERESFKVRNRVSNLCLQDDGSEEKFKVRKRVGTE